MVRPIGPPQAGATSGRWPTVPGVTHLIARAQMGPIRTTGGAPKPQRSGTSPALFAGSCHPGSPPLVPASQLTSPGASPVPRPLLCVLAPAMSRLPLLSAPALACWCPLLFVLCFFFFLFFFFCPPPPCPLAVSPPSSPFLWVGVGVGGGGGGGVLAVRPTAQARRKHGAGTRHGTCPSAGGGGGCRVAPVVTLPFLRLHPRRPPRWGLHGACSPWARSCGSFRTLVPLPPHPAAVSSGGGGPPPATVIPLVPSPSPRCPRLFPWWVWEVGAGGGGRPRCPSSGVSTLQARHWHVARHLSFCWGVGHAAWSPSSPCPLCVRSPGAPPAGACSALASLGRGRAVRPAPSPRCPPIMPLCPREGGPLSAPPFLHPPPLGERRHVGGGGGGLVVFPPLLSRRRHEARLPSLCWGGGVCLAAPFVAPSTLRPHPRWSPRRGLHGARPLRARSCGSSRTLLPLPPHPAALPSGGGGRFSPPPLPAFPALGEAVVLGGGRGALFASPPLHARRRHDVGTTHPRGEALGCSRWGGGVSLWAFPLCSMVQAPHSRITSRCCPLSGSRHVSAWCLVSRACSLLCPYLLEEVRTRVDSEDEEMRAAGRTYRTPRRLLAPSAALVEGRAPVSAPNSPGGADRPSSPWCLCIHFRAA